MIKETKVLLLSFKSFFFFSEQEIFNKEFLAFVRRVGKMSPNLGKSE